MKYITILFLGLIPFFTIGQTNIEAQYIEILPQMTGWKFRISPSSDFQRIGLLGSEVEPYFKDNLAVQNAFQEYKSNMKVYFIGTGITAVSYGVLITTLESNNQNLLLGSGIVATIGGLVMVLGRRKANSKLYEAVELHNHNKRPISTSLIPKIQSSSHSIGIGLVWEIK